MLMRTVNLTTLMMVSLAIMWLTLAPSTACASDGEQLSAKELAFLSRAMSDNAAQIAMARMALAKSKNPQVVDLANAIIQERTALDQQLAALASGSIDRTAVQQSVMDNPRMAALQSLNGDAFDKTFAGLLVRDHYQIICAYESMKAASTHDALKSVAHDAVPALQGDLMVALAFLRSGSWTPSIHQEALTSTDSRSSKVPSVYGEPISIVTAPW
jgi:putative membrane protein